MPSIPSLPRCPSSGTDRDRCGPRRRDDVLLACHPDRVPLFYDGDEARFRRWQTRTNPLGNMESPYSMLHSDRTSAGGAYPCRSALAAAFTASSCTRIWPIKARENRRGPEDTPRASYRQGRTSRSASRRLCFATAILRYHRKHRREEISVRNSRS